MDTIQETSHVLVQLTHAKQQLESSRLEKIGLQQALANRIETQSNSIDLDPTRSLQDQLSEQAHLRAHAELALHHFKQARQNEREKSRSRLKRRNAQITRLRKANHRLEMENTNLIDACSELEQINDAVVQDNHTYKVQQWEAAFAGGGNGSSGGGGGSSSSSDATTGPTQWSQADVLSLSHHTTPMKEKKRVKAKDLQQMHSHTTSTRLQHQLLPQEQQPTSLPALGTRKKQPTVHKQRNRKEKRQQHGTEKYQSKNNAALSMREKEKRRLRKKRESQLREEHVELQKKLKAERRLKKHGTLHRTGYYVYVVVVVWYCVFSLCH